jgi:predicted transcriptional regulator
MPNTPQRYTRIEDETWDRFVALAEDDRRTPSALLRLLVMDYVDAHADVDHADTTPAEEPRE